MSAFPRRDRGRILSITPDTRVLALLGDPVEHSLSPLIQNRAFRETGVDGVYVALRCGSGDAPALLRALALAGGGGNVTLPHKERAAAALDRPSDAVRRSGACNTFWGEDDLVHGDNTDVEGFRRALEIFRGEAGEDAGPAQGRILVLGAGGAARAVLVALLESGEEDIVLLNRNFDRARGVARSIGGERVHVLDDPKRLKGLSFDLLVNATRLGLDPKDPLPVDLGLPARVGGVFDLVYGTATTPLVADARARGLAATDGREMLVQQAAVAFERWWKVPAPVEAMREALGDVG